MIRLDALRAYVRWRMHGVRRRFAKRGFARPRRLRLDDGIVVWARLSEFGGARIYVYGSTEYFSTALFKELIAPGATVIDVGANLGEYTLIAAKHVGRAGSVLAFEPLPETFALLERSVSENGFDNVRMFQVALSDRDGRATLRLPPSSNSGLASLAAAHDDDGFEVECMRLDTVLERNRAGRVDVMKIDVEGFEHQVIVGACRTLAHDKPMILFEVNGTVRGGDGWTARSIDALRQLGYRMYGVEGLKGRRWRLVELRVSEDPSRFRDRWETDAFPPNLLAAHPGNSRSTDVLDRLLPTARR